MHDLMKEMGIDNKVSCFKAFWHGCDNVLTAFSCAKFLTLTCDNASNNSYNDAEPHQAPKCLSP